MLGAVNGTTGGGMPSMRRRRPHLSSVRTNQIEVHGTTYLCFPLDHTWFQGNINTNDESSYSLYGERVSPDPEIRMVENGNDKHKGCNEENNNNELGENNEEAGDLNNPEQGYYKVTLTDHFTGLCHHLPKIIMGQKPEDDNLFTCTDAEVKFRVENIYKGQKADMVMQSCLGSSSLLGQKCLVYSGPISIVFNEVVETGRSWCL